jgi:hypothetical protein
VNHATATEIWDRWTGYAVPADEVAEMLASGRTADEHAAELADSLAECHQWDGCGAESRDTLVEAFAIVLQHVTITR